jgi:hypothetical protein
MEGAEEGGEAARKSATVDMDVRHGGCIAVVTIMIEEARHE